MSRSTSFFLDLLRLLAAGMVFALHCAFFWWPNSANGMLGSAGHRAVIIFFVLSGYVIAYSTLRKAIPLKDYVTARLARLYSVVLPALILTALLEIFGSRLNPHLYHDYNRGHEVGRYVLTTFFLQTLWRSNTAPASNGPFWSLGYEFWYYAFFAAAVFIKPLRWKIVGILAVFAIMGIDGLLLLPAWIAGVLVYLSGRKVTIRESWALPGAAVALLATVAAVLFLPNWPGVFGRPPFFYSEAFLTDDVVALLLAATIGLTDQALRSTNISRRLDAAVRWTADHTFSLYLYHFPLMLFVTAILPFDYSSVLQSSGVIAMILLIVLLLSLVTEAQRGHWRNFFAWCWDCAATRSFRRHPPSTLLS